MDLVAGDDVECDGEQCVAGENGGSLIEGAMRGRFFWGCRRNPLLSVKV
jgi:hypothetical protein